MDWVVQIVATLTPPVVMLAVFWWFDRKAATSAASDPTTEGDMKVSRPSRGLLIFSYGLSAICLAIILPKVLVDSSLCGSSS